MKATVVRIGNSRGIRIPKLLLEQCGLMDEVDLVVSEGGLLVRPASAPRSGWEDAFRRMAARGDDRLVDAEGWPASGWDRSEWEW